MRRSTAAGALVLWGALAAMPAASEGPPGEEFAFATLNGEVHVGFAMVRTGAARAAPVIGDAVFPRSNSVTRILYDQEAGTYFGYRLIASILPTGDRFRVEFGPLTGNEAGELKRSIDCPDCPTPELLGSPSRRFPGPRLVSPAERISLELLVNPSTGEKIVDVAGPPGVEVEIGLVDQPPEQKEDHRMNLELVAAQLIDAAVSLNETLGNGQSQPCTGRFRTANSLQLGKWLKDE